MDNEWKIANGCDYKDTLDVTIILQIIVQHDRRTAPVAWHSLDSDLGGVVGL